MERGLLGNEPGRLSRDQIMKSLEGMTRAVWTLVERSLEMRLQWRQDRKQGEPFPGVRVKKDGIVI